MSRSPLPLSLLLALAHCGGRTTLDASAAAAAAPDAAMGRACEGGRCPTDAATHLEAHSPEGSASEAGPIEASAEGDTSESGPIEASTDGGACGGITGVPCASGLWCDLGSCSPPADGTGICTPIPDDSSNTCPMLCGCDGQWYCNAYEAFLTGVLVGPTAPCLPPDGCDTCAGGCGPNAWCSGADPTTGRDTCIENCRVGSCLVRPTGCGSTGGGVCACNGETYPDSCEAHAAGTDVATSGGACGG